MRTTQSRLYEVELEIQNQELRSSRELLEETLDLYANLYDFAAVGCITFDKHGCIKEINLTGARLLEMERERIIGKPFVSRLVPESRLAFSSHLRQCREGKLRVVTRLRLLPKKGDTIPILLISAKNELSRLRHQSALIDLRDIEC